MEIQQLTTFLEASHTLSFTKTAEKLGYSQAAVTIQIKQLEAELGVILFDRIGKKITLTTEGKTLQHYASHILSSVHEAQMILREHKPSGLIRIGASDSLCTYVLPPIIAHFHKHYPEITLSIKTESAPNLLNLLKQNELDLVCLFAEKTSLSDYQILFEKPEPFVFIVGSHHPLTSCTSLSLTTLEKEPLLLTEPGCSYRKLLEQIFAAHHLSPTPLLEIGNTEAIKRYCIENLGIALLPYFTITKECQKGTLHPLDVGPLNLSLDHTLLCHKQKYLSPALNAFTSLYIDAQTSS